MKIYLEEAKQKKFGEIHMEIKLRFFLVMMLFSFFSCKMKPKNLCKITNIQESQSILLENQDGKNVFKLRLKIEENINGNAQFLINDNNQKGSGLKFDLKKTSKEILSVDWYSNQCYFYYIPDKINSPNSGEILIWYEFLTM
jgi:hypothetical protein